ncbi:phosphatase PAP2 family protein [Nocardia veterana]|uniref:phosphatase PAP2 family protein n=1 Tax=Nocardia veterana TaxID=132249 RepID=UPI00031FF064|nr:phosphatase PAP2 family protein [Nocardia veterana]
MHAPPPITPHRPQPLVVAVVVLIGLLTTVTLPLSFPAGGGPTAFDRAIGDRVHERLDAHRGVYDALVVPSDAYIVLPLLLIGIGYCLWRRERWAAVFLLVVPELVVAINTWVLKPLWGRHLQHYLAYPSGHTVQFVAIATGLLLVAAAGWIRIALAAVALLALAAVAVGMIGLGYHYPTDIVGGTAFAAAAVTAAWSGLCRLRGRTDGRRDVGETRPAADTVVDTGFVPGQVGKPGAADGDQAGP